jgi:hypothetical protein
MFLRETRDLFDEAEECLCHIFTLPL